MRSGIISRGCKAGAFRDGIEVVDLSVFPVAGVVGASSSSGHNPSSASLSNWSSVTRINRSWDEAEVGLLGGELAGDECALFECRWDMAVDQCKVRCQQQSDYRSEKSYAPTEQWTELG